MALSATLLSGRYELDEPIGAGGFSEVWRATDTVLARQVAIKLLYPSYAHQAEARARFQAEARHAGALSHKNIARIYDYAEPEEGRPYLVMELVAGPSLASLLRSGPLDAARSMDVVAQAAAGLRVAHAAGLIHRDIKPANLLLCPDGSLKITDFGIAHAVGSAPVTVTGTLIGTPSYMAPERVAGAQATPASDLYALGVVAYECLAGAPPFSGVPLEVALAHRERPLPPLPPSVPVEVAAFVMLLTAKDAAWRPASAAEVERRAAALRDALRAGGAAPASPAEASGDPSRAFRALPALAPDTRDDRRRPLLAPLPGTARAGRPALAVTCILLAALTGLVLASVLGFALPQHQASAPSVASSVPQAGHVRPEHRVGQARVVRPAPSARPASAPTSDEAVLRTAGPREQRSPHGHRPTKGPGKGPSKDRSKGTGGGPGKDPGKGPGKGSGEQGGAGGGDGPVGGQGSQALGA